MEKSGQIGRNRGEALRTFDDGSQTHHDPAQDARP